MRKETFLGSSLISCSETSEQGCWGVYLWFILRGKAPCSNLSHASESRLSCSLSLQTSSPPVPLAPAQWAVKWQQGWKPSSRDTWKHEKEKKKPKKLKESRKSVLRIFVGRSQYSSNFFLSYHLVQLLEQVEGGKLIEWKSKRMKCFQNLHWGSNDSYVDFTEGLLDK